MKAKVLYLAAIAVVAVFVSCSLPQLSVISTTPSADGSTPTASAAASPSSSGTSDSQPGTTTPAITVTNNLSRGVAILTSTSGVKTEISTTDPATGTVVTCVRADAYSVIPQPGNSKSDTVLVVGTRNDGSPGAWQVSSKGKVELVGNDYKGHDGDLNPEHGKEPERLYRHLGWAYHVTAISDDGKMIVGYAENAKGYTKGKFSVPAGTTVGIYWRIYQSKHGSHFHTSPPQVIGTWQPPKNKHGDDHHDRRDHREKDRHSKRYQHLELLKLFFVGRLQSYLIMTTGVKYDSGTDAYLVTGTDQDGNDAIATISKEGSVSIEEVQTPPPPPPSTTYSEIVIDTFNPTGLAPVLNSDTVALFSESGVVNSANPWTNPSAGVLAIDGETAAGGSNPNGVQTGWGYIVYKPATPLPSGTVLYVRITGYDPAAGDTSGASAWSGAYGIRVLATPSGSYTYFSATNPTDASYEPDNPPDSGAVPTPPAVITTLTNTQGLNRYLAQGDVDWVKITLP